jgi:hypothetical protein
MASHLPVVSARPHKESGRAEERKSGRAEERKSGRVAAPRTRISHSSVASRVSSAKTKNFQNSEKVRCPPKGDRPPGPISLPAPVVRILAYFRLTRPRDCVGLIETESQSQLAR